MKMKQFMRKAVDDLFKAQTGDSWVYSRQWMVYPVIVRLRPTTTRVLEARSLDVEIARLEASSGDPDVIEKKRRHGADRRQATRSMLESSWLPFGNQVPSSSWKCRFALLQLLQLS